MVYRNWPHRIQFQTGVEAIRSLFVGPRWTNFTCMLVYRSLLFAISSFLIYFENIISWHGARHYIPKRDISERSFKTEYYSALLFVRRPFHDKLNRNTARFLLLDSLSVWTGVITIWSRVHLSPFQLSYSEPSQAKSGVHWEPSVAWNCGETAAWEAETFLSSYIIN